MSRPIRTLGPIRGAPQAMQARNLRRIGIVTLTAVVGLALAGVFGPTEGRVVAAAGGYRVELVHPSVTRSSVAAPLHLRITRAGGFGEQPVRVAIEDDLFDRLDFQNWYPNPSAETSGATQVVYDFDPPPGEVLEVSLDARTGPTQWFSSRTYEASVLESGRPVLTVAFRMTVLP